MSSRELLQSGYRAELSPAKHEPNLWTLTVDGTPQSQVDTADPTRLHFDYVRRMGFVLDAIAAPRQPLTALHVGAGALTLPRYLDATRPGSRQQVIELERDLIEWVREALPWDRAASIRLRYGDAREVLGTLPTGLSGTVDVAVIDVFSGARTPAHVTSAEFYQLLAPLLSANGIVLVNIADGAPLNFARGQLATLGSVWPELAAIADTAVLKGRRFGNVVAVAGASELPLAQLPRKLAADVFPAKLITGEELAHFVAGARVVTDASATPSPLPARSIFIERRS